MKQLLLEKGKVLLKEVPKPELFPQNLLIRVHYSFVSSGTEGATIAASATSLAAQFMTNAVGNIKKLSKAINENGIGGAIALVGGKRHQLLSLGYSCAGQVVAIGDEVKHFVVGDYVACAGGSATHSEVVSVPQNLAVKVLEKSLLKEASVTAIGAIAMQGLRRADVRFGEIVCIVGLGLIGQITAQLAKHAGCMVIGVDLNNQRLALAKSLGCDVVLNALSDNLQNEIAFRTEHYGVDATLLCAGADTGSLIDQAMLITRKKGKVVLVGDVKLHFSRDLFYAKEIDFLSSCSYGPGRYDRWYEEEGIDYPYAFVRWTENRNMRLFVALLAQKKVDISGIISHEFSQDDAQKAYQQLRNQDAMGIVLSYPSSHCFLPEQKPHKKKIDLIGVSKQEVALLDKPKKKLRVGFVGVGGFAKVKLLPLLSKMTNAKLHAVVDSKNANALTVARQYGAAVIEGTHIDLAKSDINAVVIATPHRFHTQQAIDCLKAGKAVFVEKPAAVSEHEFALLTSYLKAHPHCIYCVDFNRSWAPFNEAIKQALAGRITPLMITYRMNAGFVSGDHWVQSKKDGGRIIGEACHIFELFCFLTDSYPKEVVVGAVCSDRDDIAALDNVVADIRFADGSVCSLLYTALGNKDLPKERMELFFDGKSIVMEDYCTLTGYGLPTIFNKKTSRPNKGHAKLFETFIAVVTGLQSPTALPVERILLATEISFVVDRLARQGGGSEHISVS